ncbi:MAG TPA: protein phosphatase 2C domain-containing protein [Planctomycetaceae bacterium]|nr:protein phosphatase 2C domain-containing protein [Planctomycetaceae bacterium]
MQDEEKYQNMIAVMLHRWGLSNEGSDTGKSEWQKLNSDQVSEKICSAVAKAVLGRILKQQLNGSLKLSNTDEALLKAFRDWGFANERGKEDVQRIAIQALKAAVPQSAAAVQQVSSSSAPSQSPSPVPSPAASASGAYKNPAQSVSRPVAISGSPLPNGPLNTGAHKPKTDTSPPSPAVTAAPSTNKLPSNPTPEVPAPISPPARVPATTPVPATTLSQWLYLPLPTDEPDPHTEFDRREGSSFESFPILGSRVRGKKHKHDGTHCDDWFSFANAGPWTILAVSDGGGSYRFSRVGARASCEAATEYLSKKLAEYTPKNRNTWEPASFSEPDIEDVKTCLVDSVIAGWNAVTAAVKERTTNPVYEQLLGRPLSTKDLYCTLLVAVHMTVPYEDGERSLIFGLAVGDGMVAAVNQSGRSLLLMTPDSGEHSGEVRFLDQREVDPDKLRAKIFPALCDLRALMLMTDGVADDYFPNDPGMTWLYGDLVLNGVLPIPSDSDSDLEKALAGTKVSSASEFSAISCVSEFEQLKLDQTMQKVQVRSISQLAEQLGLPPEEVVRRAALLKAKAVESPSSALQSLQNWLDSYHVRGSFDDRTLLVMHR